MFNSALNTPAPFTAGQVVREKPGCTGIGGRGGNTYLITGCVTRDRGGDVGLVWIAQVRRFIKTTQKYSGTVYHLRTEDLEVVG